MSAVPVPVTLLHGLGAGAPERAGRLERWLARRPPQERWAVIAEGGVALPAFDRSSVVIAQIGGCACCTGALVLRVTLTRLLRQGPWHRVVILAGAAARPQALAEQLRAAPFAGLLAVPACEHAPPP